MLAEQQWALVFGAAKKRGARWADKADVEAFKREVEAAIAASVPLLPKHRTVSQAGIDLLHQFEGCKLEAYPDPGSRDGTPWTIGWGSTGPDITKGTVWTQKQADERFKQDLDTKYAPAVDALLPRVGTSQCQFDALVCLTYNIGINGLKRSTVLRKHKAGDYKGAAAAFVMWNKNDGKVMRGLTRRRLAESDLYDCD